MPSLRADMDDRGHYGSLVERARNFVRRGAASQTIRNTSWLGSSSLLNGLLGALAAAILARTLGIDGFGTYTLLLTLTNLLTDLADLGLGSTMVRFGAESLARGDRGTFDRLVGLILRFKMALGCVVIGMALLALRPLLGGLFGHVNAHIESYALIAIVAAVVAIPAAIFAPVFQASGNFRANALTTIVRSGSRLVLLLLLVLAAGGVTIQTALWIDAASILIFLAVSTAIFPVWRPNPPGTDPAMVRSVLTFTRWFAFQQIIILIGTRIDVFVVGGLTDARTLGIYGAAARVIGLVIAVTNSYYAVLLSEVSTVASSPDAVARKRGLALKIVSAMAAGILLLALLADPLIALLYGSRFAESAAVVQIMCLGLLATVFGYPFCAVLFAERRTGIFPLIALLSAAGTLGGNVLLLPLFGATGGAMAFAISGLLSLLAGGGYYALSRGRTPGGKG